MEQDNQPSQNPGFTQRHPFITVSIVFALFMLFVALGIYITYHSDEPAPVPESSSASPSPSSAVTARTSEHQHDIVPIPDVDPTCETDGHTGGERCSVCGFITTVPTVVEKLGHTCETGICERCSTAVRYGVAAPLTGIWNSGVYKDEFGDPTEDLVVFTNPITGTFSNSATNNSKLAVFLYAEEREIKIALFEYEKLRVTFSIYSYEVHIKHGDTKETLYVDLEDGMLLFDYNNFSKLRGILLIGEDIQFVISESGGTSTYKFSVSASNFFAEYLYTFPPSTSGDLPISIFPLTKTEALNSFQKALNEYPSIVSFDVSSMWKVYSYIVDDLVKYYLKGSSPTQSETEKAQTKAASKYEISPDQAKLIYEFVSSNYDLVKIVLDYNQ